MKFLRNIKIRTKFLLFFGVLVAFVLVLAAVNISVNTEITYLSKKVRDSDINHMESAKELNALLVKNTVGINDFILQYGDNPTMDSNRESEILSRSEDIKKRLQAHLDMVIRQEKKDAANNAIDAYSGYHTYLENVFSTIKSSGILEAESYSSANLSTVENTQKAFGDQLDICFYSSVERITEIIDLSAQNTYAVVIIMVVYLLFVILIAYLLIVLIARRLAPLIVVANKEAQGDFSTEIDSEDEDEIGELTRAMNEMSHSVKGLVDGIGGMADDFDKGEIDRRLDTSDLRGSYAEVGERVNVMVSMIIDEVLETVDVLSKIGNGDFSAKLRKFPGKKAVLNQVTDEFAEKLTDIKSEIDTLISAAIDGKLNTRADHEKYEGDWKVIIQDLNSLLGYVIEPIFDASNMLDKMSTGDLSHRITANYKGDFAVISDTLNKTCDILQGYIEEITYTLGQLASENFDIEITDDYIGEFEPIKISINNIVDKFNDVLYEISTSSEQVAAGARHISESSITLAQGATEQSASVEEMRDVINNVKVQAEENADIADKANSISKQAMDDVAKGNREMHNMLNAMDEINKSSENISNIIKVIQDIASQTNLLSLNAAVEAARAGQHGKGFAVVAEEVGNLAGRSQEAARTTSALIDGSVQKVKEGMGIANLTAQALNDVSSGMQEVTALVTQISVASLNQREAIGRADSGIEQIATVAQSNTASSEEEAAAAQQLSSQSEVLKNTVSKFNLRDENKKSKRADKKTTEAKTVEAVQKKVEAKPAKPAVAAPKKAGAKPAVTAPKKVEAKPAVTAQKKVGAKPAVTAPKKVEAKPAVTAQKKVEAKPATTAPKKPTASTPKATVTRNTASKPAGRPSPSRGGDKKDSHFKQVSAPVNITKKVPVESGSGAGVYEQRNFGKY